ncbi:Hypothetical predicted protein [Octopus vulgaris]|uniref:Uncharacterized protein n=1 Tax=Octopus vulgaris TaxID=6645 RepID=A0AA36AFQ2_OCTVU|nr:Hypothetical predicted protein [Octopus vulgaris]
MKLFRIFIRKMIRSLVVFYEIIPTHVRERLKPNGMLQYDSKKCDLHFSSNAKRNYRIVEKTHCQPRSDVPYFTLKCDGTRDLSNTENLAIVIRYLKNGRVLEKLVAMPTTQHYDAETLADL